MEGRTKQGEYLALVVKGHTSNPGIGRYLIEVPGPLPAAPLVVRRRYLILVLWPLPRCASRVLKRGAKADVRGATQVLDRGGQAVARGSCCSQVLDRGAQADARKAVPCAPKVLDRGAKAVARGAACCASHVLDRVVSAGSQAGAQAVVCGDAMLPQQEKGAPRMSRRAELTLKASSAQRKDNPRA